MHSDEDFEPLEDETEEELDSGLTTMVNVSNEPIIVRISRGRRQHKTRIKPGKSHEFEHAYCDPVRGAGKDVVLPSILTRQTMKEDRIPRLVREEDAEDARAYYLRRTRATEADTRSDVERLEEELAAAKARADVAAGRKPKAAPKAAKAKPAPKAKGKPAKE